MLLGFFGLIKKIPLWLWIILIAAGYYKFTQNKIDNLQAEITKSKFEENTTTQLNDSLFARIAKDRLDKDSLRASIEAAKTLNAELIAASKIHITPKPVIRIIETPTTIQEDSTRIKLINDTTTAGILTGKFVAPPFPEDLDINYIFNPATIDPTISLLRLKDNTAIFAVTYSGGATQISVPFVKIPAKLKRFEWYVESMYNLQTANINVSGGAQWNVIRSKGISVFGRIQQEIDSNTDPYVFVGIRKTFK